MTDFIDVPPAPQPSPTPPDDNPNRPNCTEAEIADGKALSVISYALNFIGIPFFVVPLIMRSDRFSLYHAKQCLILWLVAIIGGIAWKIVVMIIGLVTCGIGFLVALPLTIMLVVGLWVINILGLINAANGRCAPHWLIGTLGENWFAGIRVQPKPGNPQ